jgi:hypothetical protein
MIYEKLLNIQNELKAPKSQFNAFGKYKYRNAEDILESVKPLCFKYKATLTLSDEIVLIGERHYVKATATLTDIEKPELKIWTTAYAREEESKKGMDGSQVTGASSSYARKYALNGLFNIDDTKDSDSTNTHGKDDKETTTQEVTNEEILKLFALAEQAGYSKDTVFKQVKEKYKKEIENLKKAEYNQLFTGYTKLVKMNEKK